MSVTLGDRSVLCNDAIVTYNVVSAMRSDMSVTCSDISVTYCHW